MTRKAPKGKFRVWGVDLFDHDDDYLVDDYCNLEDAIKVAKKHNDARKGSMDDVYYVYNDMSKCVYDGPGKQGIDP